MTIPASALAEFSNQCLAKAGVPPDEASLITSTLIEADARGIHSHGLMRLPLYVARIRKGLNRTAAWIETVGGHGATAVLDAHYSAGQVAAERAMDLAIDKAGEHGVGAVLVKNSNHFGIASHYALKAVDSGMIGLAASNTTPLMPPTGGAEKILGNNPLAIAAPSGTPFPLLLDMALSNVALGKILHAKTTGASIPEGWGADQSGKPTTDPAAVLDGGFLLPVGGPKGFGLAFMIELLTGVLGGAQFSRLIPSMYDLTQRQSIAHFMLVIDVARFIGIDRFKESASQLSGFVKNAAKAEGVEELYLPGEIEFRKEKERLASGIPIDGKVLAELNELAVSLGVPAMNL
jgi:LDH2 family malate/lactate/ureidoglycolate dehydrogenase